MDQESSSKQPPTIKEHATLVPPDYHRCKYCQSAIIDTTRHSSIFWWLASRRTSLLVDVGGDGGWPVLRVSIPDAVAAAEAGCALFQTFVLTKGLNIDKCQPFDKFVRVFLEYKLSQKPRCHFLLKSEPSNTTISYSFSWHLEIFATKESPASKWILPAANIDFRSKASLNFVRQCVSDCLKNHKTCDKTRNSQQPSRLLDLNSPSSAQDTIILTTPEVRSSYAALSYCWGGEMGFQTTESTLNHASLGLKLDEVPKTIQDAIFVTRGLGLRYLWVDRLCIVQDSAEEFAHEMNKMRDIYTGSRITISAANAASSEEGFLHRRSRPPTSLQLQFCCPTGEIGSVIVVQQRSHTEPINTRGWTLQESLLPERLVFYGSHQLEWSCRTVSKADGGFATRNLVGPTRSKPNFLRNILWGTDDNPAFPPQIGHKKSILRIWRNHSYTKRDVYDMWLRLVEHYTQRNLSYPGDKLVAISALAIYANARLKDQYIAGMWRQYLRSQLMWRSCQPETAHRTREYIAPSWSWASLKGQVEWGAMVHWKPHSKSFIPILDILSHEVVPISPEAPYGAISSGNLRISGLVMSSLFRLVNDGGWKIWKAINDVDYKFGMFCPDTGEFLNMDGAESSKSVSLTLLLVLEYIEPTAPFGPITPALRSVSNMTVQGSYHGLVLCEEQSRGTYRRVGVFHEIVKFKGYSRQVEGPVFSTDNFRWRDITII